MKSLHYGSQTKWLSILTLLAGALALGLAAIPPIVLDRPFALAPAQKPPPPPLAPRDGGVTFKLGKLEVNVGGKAALPQPAAAMPGPANRLKWFLVSAMSVALATVIGGAFAWQRERRPALSGTGMALGVLAITWQYIIIGVAIGVAVAIILIFLSSLG